MRKDNKILICYNAPHSLFTVYSGKPEDIGKDLNDLSESSLIEEVENIKNILSEFYSNVDTLAVSNDIEDFIDRIKLYDPDIIYNFVESIEGVSSFEYCIAGLYQLLQYEFTGNLPVCLGNCLDKGRSKKILKGFDINTPDSIIFHYKKITGRRIMDLNYPVILKLLNEDASIGISEYSVVDNDEDFEKQLSFLFDTYKQDVLVEEFIEGREINAAILGGNILPLSEIQFEGLPEGKPKIVTYEGKWIAESVYYKNTVPKCPAEIDESVRRRIEETALKAYKALDCRDYARVDIRLSKDNIPYVIEVNPNPDISSDAGFARAAKAAGLSYEEFLCTIAEFSLNRTMNDTQVAVC